MGLISKPNTFAPSTTIDSSDVNANFDTIYNEFNGNISSANLDSSAVDSGSLADGAVTTAKLGTGSVTTAKLSTALQGGWEDAYGATTFPTPNTITNNGNRSYDLVFNSVDLTSVLSPGMRLRLTRTVTAPTQCADLEASSSQYFSKTSPAGITFTDDFTCMGWVKLESYGGVNGIIARRNASTEGWGLSVTSTGQVTMTSLRIAANNSVTTSAQSIPLGKWVHIAATTDLSGTSVLIYIDGVLVPSTTVITGTITALVQGTVAMTVGADRSDGTNPFDGKIAQAAVFSSVLSAATIRSYMSQGLSGSESTMVAGYSLSNSLLDLTSNDNDLSANGSAVATATDSPFAMGADATGGYTAGTTEFGIVTKVAFSTNTTVTVQVPEGGAIPTSGGVSAVAYSVQKAPLGFPANEDKWVVETFLGSSAGQVVVAGTLEESGAQIIVPVGAWKLGYQGRTTQSNSSAGIYSPIVALSTSTSAVSDTRLVDQPVSRTSGTTSEAFSIERQALVNLSSATTYYFILTASSGGGTINVGFSAGVDNATAPFSSSLFAICALL